MVIEGSFRQSASSMNYCAVLNSASGAGGPAGSAAAALSSPEETPQTLRIASRDMSAGGV
jgi:hypothetical protein